MFLLNILLSGLVLLKCFFTRAMNLDPIFVVTAALKGGVNQIIFLLRFFLLVVFSSDVSFALSTYSSVSL